MSFVNRQPDMFECGGRLPAWPFGSLEPGAYSLIMIDCAWRFRTFSDKGGSKSPQAHYRTMTLDECSALPVASLAHDDGALLWMWCTAPGLAEQLRMMTDAWEFKYVTSGAWVKTTRHGKVSFGTGYVLRNAHEPFVIGRIGKVRTHSRGVRSVLMEQVREHSRKPDGAYSAAKKLVPIGRAADVYSREHRPGWESYGDQAGKFNQQEGQPCSAPSQPSL